LELLTALKSLTKLRSRLLGVVFDSSPLTRYESVNLYGRPCCSKRSGGAGTLARLTIFSQTARQTKKRGSRRAFICSPDGDPQTYALLYCSVFKERMLMRGPFRTGSLLTAPKWRFINITAAIVSPSHLRVNP